jgi:uncharacterized protein (TIGR02611 family)
MISSLGKNGQAVLRFAWRMIVLVVGVTVVAIGVAMLVLPGPAFVVIPLGLGILAAEFAWARRLIDRLKHEGRKALPKRWEWIFGKIEQHGQEKHAREERREHENTPH